MSLEAPDNKKPPFLKRFFLGLAAFGKGCVSLTLRFLKAWAQSLKKTWVLLVHLCLVTQFILAWFFIEPDLSKTVVEHPPVQDLLGIPLPLGGFDFHVVRNLLIVIALVFAFFFYVTRNLKEKPGRVQIIVEFLIKFFNSLCVDTLGERGRAFVPYIGSIFILVWSCNMLGVFPPFLHEPTANMNVPIGLGIIAFFVSHTVAIKVKGVKEWLLPYFVQAPHLKFLTYLYVSLGLALLFFILNFFFMQNPTMDRFIYSLLTGTGVGIVNTGWLHATIHKLKWKEGAMTTLGLVLAGGLLYLLLQVPWFNWPGFIIGIALLQIYPFCRATYIPNPLEVVGEAGKLISHSMRLFGNIFGGVIIMVVVSNLVYYVGLPSFLVFFFGIFVGTVQAFVFAMLALVYTAVLVAEE